jgi:hypothetical protein
MFFDQTKRPKAKFEIVLQWETRCRQPSILRPKMWLVPLAWSGIPFNLS